MNVDDLVASTDVTVSVSSSPPVDAQPLSQLSPPSAAPNRSEAELTNDLYIPTLANSITESADDQTLSAPTIAH